MSSASPNIPFVSLRDPWLIAGGVLATAIAAVVAVPLLHGRDLAAFATTDSLIAWMMLLVAVVITSQHRRTDPGERRLWPFFAVAYSAWALGEWLPSTRFLDATTARGGLVVDALFALTYLSWVLGLELRPWAAAGRRSGDLRPAFGWLSRTLVICGLFLYFVVLPRWLSPQLYVTWTNSYLLYLALDGYLIARLSVRLLTDPGSPWRHHLALLIGAFVLLATTDLLTLLSSLGRIELSYGGPLDILWHGHFVLVLVAARAWPRRRLERPAPTVLEPFEERQGIPLIAYGFAFPILHLGLSLTGPAVPTLTRSREVLVLAWLLLLGVLSLVQHARLDRLRRETDRRRREAEEQIRFLSRHDPLTGLLNRRELGAALGRAIVAADRRGSGFTVLFIDLDGFKELNDTLGHATGDRALVSAASRLQACLRESDVLIRYGGDEFVVVLDEISTADEALSTANRLLASLHAPSTIDGVEVTLPASIGVALYPESGDTAETLLEAADRAMYRAKLTGGSRCRLPESTP